VNREPPGGYTCRVTWVPGGRELRSTCSCGATRTVNDPAGTWDWFSEHLETRHPGGGDFDDIPGTTMFTARMARRGYHLNQFCMSLMSERNRERFLAGEREYLDGWPMSEQQKLAVLDRDLNRLIALGGNIYYLAKLVAADGKPFIHAVSTMTGMTVQEYQAMMLGGGRSADGWRSRTERP
jgi:protocatechuate 4,5-dioxygenase, alpha chain